MKTLEKFDKETRKNVKAWLDGGYDEETKREIRKLLDEHPEEITDAFYRNLEFGTGGLRALMGVGCNRVNSYTVKIATQALANYIHKQKFPEKVPSVFISYDSRHHSHEFALDAAKVLSGNGIRAYIFKELRPLPLVSFGCRLKKCRAALMITASHCLKEYNGYKVFWEDGAQVLPPHDKGIIAEVDKIQDITQIKEGGAELIEEVDQEVDIAYLEAIHTLQNYPKENAKHGRELKVVYTPLHGSGIAMVPRGLESWGFTALSIVKKQEKPDGDFPTVISPNPEEHAALALGIEQLLKEKADILIGTDPDSDRVGAAVAHQGEAVLISGNQMAALCTEHVCEALQKQGRLPKNGAFVKTIVSTELITRIAEKYQMHSFDVLTGFKYIAEKLRAWDVDKSYRFLFGGEESYGYLLGTFVRDKDAVVSSCLICELALAAKLQGKTLVDKLHDLYIKYGVHTESLVNLKFPESKEGAEQREKLMKKLREQSPKEFNGVPVEILEDYKSSEARNLQTGKITRIDLPVSNVLRFWLKDGSKLTIRPSGTEPKVKLYVGVVEQHSGNLDNELKICQKRMDALAAAFQRLL